MTDDLNAVLFLRRAEGATRDPERAAATQQPATLSEAIKQKELSIRRGTASNALRHKASSCCGTESSPQRQTAQQETRKAEISESEAAQNRTNRLQKSSAVHEMRKNTQTAKRDRAKMNGGNVKAMLSYTKAARRVCGLIPALALPFAIAACSSPKAEAPAMNAVVDGNCAIDGQGRSKGKVSFNGWAVGNAKVAPQSITVTIGDSQPIKAVLYDRPDIAKAYQSQALTKTGFRVEVEESKAPAGAEIKIFANQSDKVHQCTKTFTLK